MTTFGTCHFVSRSAAIRYYRTQGYVQPGPAVDEALKEGRIKIGRPDHLAKDHRITVNREEGRYMATALDTAE